MFSVWSLLDDEFEMTDHDLKAITINRGAAGAVFGEQDHTMEINSAVVRGVRTDYPIRCQLTNYGAQHLADRLGGDPAAFQDRFYGRIGRQVVDDAGGIGVEGGKWETSIYASKWQSQLRNLQRVGWQNNGEPVMSLFEQFIFRQYNNLPHMPNPIFPSDSWDYGTMKNDYDYEQQQITYGDFSTKYFDDLGYYVQNTRAGADQVLTIERRWSLAQYRLDKMLPLTRAQVLAPSQWEQPNEDRPRNHTVIYQLVGNSEWQRRTIGPDPDDPRIELAEHDVSYVGWPTLYQPTQMLAARYAQERTNTGYSLPSVEIDLLRLIDSDSEADRTQARQLLELEMGDPIYLSNDWANQIRGIHYATGITESISADGWNMTLSLVPTNVVVGEWSPDVTPQSWDSAREFWDEETRAWNQATR